jgi:hypothetical protein
VSFLRPLLLVLFLILSLVAPARAWTSRTAEASGLGSIGRLIEYFENAKGRLPESWNELDEFLGKPLDGTFPLVLPTRRYELFSPPLDLRIHEKHSMRVVAMTRKSMWETTRTGSMGRTTEIIGPGRYVLRREEDGKFFIRWFEESEIQRLWPTTGRALPVPDQEPERPWVTIARRQILMKRVGIGALVAGVIVWLVVRLRGARNAGTTPLPD